MQQSVTISWQQGSEIIASSKTYEADSYGGGDYPIPSGANNLEIDLQIESGVASQLVFMTSDKDLTVKTNSTSAPQETIDLKANVPVLIRADAWPVAAFGGDVTKLFASNASGAAANLRIRFLVDLTP